MVSCKKWEISLPSDPTFELCGDHQSDKKKCKIHMHRLSEGMDSVILFWVYGGSKSFTQEHKAYIYFVHLLVAYGITVATFDFRGIPKGHYFDQTGLRSRSEDTRSALKKIKEEFDPRKFSFILGGHSMGGAIVAEMLRYEAVRNSLASVVLVAPAAYHPDAHDVTFGTDFSSILRRPESWKASHAFKGVQMFEKPKLLVTYDSDEVVTSEITNAYIARGEISETNIYTLPGDHKIFGDSEDMSTWDISRINKLSKIIRKFCVSVAEEKERERHTKKKKMPKHIASI